MKNRDFRISETSRHEMTYDLPMFETKNNVDGMYRQAQEISLIYNNNHEHPISAGKVYTSAVLHLIYQTVISAYLRGTDSEPFSRITVLSQKNKDCDEVLKFYDKMFPTRLNDPRILKMEETARAFFVHQVFQANPALIAATGDMLSQKKLEFPQGTRALTAMMGSYLRGTNFTESSEEDLFSFLTRPARLYPDSLHRQITYIIEHWDTFIPETLKTLLLKSQDYMREEDKPRIAGGFGPMEVPNYTSGGSAGSEEIESFTPDRNWMPNVVMMAKSTLVWLDQLSKKYKTDISRLDQIPDQELDKLRDEGFTALWLIGLWERSPASKRIKNLCGNPDAESSAYSLKGYQIASRLGGWEALNNLRSRCWSRGIRLASDMVPNHTGLDSDWMVNHSDYFMQQSYPPFPSYSFNGPNLSDNPDIDVRIEDHYYNRTDAAVTFQRVDKRTGETSYIFHGNDGTTMPWNDTAQLDFLNPQTREAVIQQILEVARNFPIIRFDAAMTLAKRHIQRLWYPKPGTGGDIAGRTSYGMTEEDFNRSIPNEFWREVVDRISSELPDTLLLAEAFWMMESYFVRTLGMHRVYNSAFMHMLKNQENKKYRDSIKATIAFDPDILKRYVNFMNNPDEDTAIAQFGDADKYFGVCTLLATLPGLPMFGHGQIEGFREKYGMEYQRAYWDEKENEGLIEEHKRRIFPLLKMRRLFSESRYFQIFDVIANDGQVQDSVFAYTNGDDNQMALVLYNNQYEHVEGKINLSAPKLVKDGSERRMETVSLAQSLRLKRGIRRFLVYKNFNNGKTYLYQSAKLFEEGMRVSLNGYETKVFTNIYEVEDIDGVYERLYEKYQGHGITDLDHEIRVLYLEPFFEAVEQIKGQKFRKDLKAVLQGKGTSSHRRNIMQSLGSCYTYMEELETLFAKLGLNMHVMRPQTIVDLLGKLDEVCSFKVFSNANTIMDDDIVTSFAAYFLVMPFMQSNAKMEDVYRISQILQLDRFFDAPEAITTRCAILAVKQIASVQELLSERTFLDLIGRNEYQGVRWFRGESFQECMYLSFLSRALSAKDEITEESELAMRKEMDSWLRRCADAQYQLDNLLSN
ncbi:MAG: alpha-amylase family glycosyl hydrolase [Sphaerochaetaceae bacterium]|nr:alpha-amylase family glycosyl hydrolase [Sphaerochaetaceae bacterium]